MLKRLSVFIVASLFAVSAALHAQAKIPGSGYVAPPGAVCHHCDTSAENLTLRCGGRTTRINPSIPWSGENSDPGYVNRYMEGKTSCAAAWICGVGGENEGLLARQILKEKCLAGDLGDRTRFDCEPTRREYHDFGCQFPDLGNVIKSDQGTLIKCPTEPAGCGTRAKPCQICDPRWREGEVRNAPCWTGIGRVGKLMVNVCVLPSAPPPAPLEPDSAPPGPPAKPSRCVLVIFQEGAQPLAIETACPP